jgi:hypothetical protein
MKILRIPPSLFLALSAVGFVLASCKNTTTPPSTPPPLVPRYGSTLIQVYSSNDTTTITVDSASVTDPNASGSKVLKLEELSIGQLDSMYESIEPNGNVALEVTGWGDPTAFYVLPFTTISAVNSSYTGANGLVNISAVGNGAGKSFLLNGTPYATDSATVFSINSNDTDQFHYSYIPTLGLICIENYQPGSASVEPWSRWIIAYTPK